MSINRMLVSPVAVFLTVASCVAAAPLQLEGENIGLGQAVYSQPELVEALARTYEALEWQKQQIDNEDESTKSRSIVRVNHLRNLDHIGGGNLLRDLKVRTNEQSNEKQGYNLDNFNQGQVLDPGNLKNVPKWSKGCRPNDLDANGGLNKPCRLIVDINDSKRNLDRIGGGNLLRALDSQKSGRSWPSMSVRSDRLGDGGSDSTGQFDDGSSEWSTIRKTLNSIKDNNVLERDNAARDRYSRTLDRIGGGNLLRDLEGSRNFEKDVLDGDPEARRLIAGGLIPIRQSRRSLDSLSGATFGENKRCNTHRRQNEIGERNVEWRGTSNFDGIGNNGLDYFQKRNVDEIDRTGWDSFKKRRSQDAYRSSRQR